MPVRRLLLGSLVAFALMASTVVLVGSDTLGWWGMTGVVVVAAFVGASFAPAYFGIDRESHRRR